MRHPRSEPHLGSLKLSRSRLLAWLLYALLAVAAGAALLGGRGLDLVPAALRAGAPIAFGIFVGLFAAYRFAVVRAGRYPAGKAFLQVGVAALFLALLISGSLRESSYASTRTLPALLSDRDPSVRALACELVRFRPEARSYVRPLVERLDDAVPEVRAQAALSLKSIAGRDVGGAGEDSIARWRSWAETAESAGALGSSNLPGTGLPEALAIEPEPTPRAP